MTVDSRLAIIKPMRHSLSIFLIVSFLSVAVFGFLGMGMSSHDHTGCIATAVQGGACPEALGAAGFINFHFNAARFFSTAVLVVSVLAIFLVLASGVFMTSRLYELAVVLKYRLPQFLTLHVSLPKEALNFLLILQEKRDPSFLLAFS